MIFSHERFAPVNLVRGDLPIHVEDLVFGANELLRLPMTVQAPFHVEGFGFPHERHFIDRPVALGAADSLGDVDAVIEENKIGNFIDAVPSEWSTGGQALANRCQQRSVCKQWEDRGHASAGIGNSSKCGFFNRSVTIAAVDAEFLCVVPMAERNRLVERSFRARGVWRPKNCIPRPSPQK